MLAQHPLVLSLLCIVFQGSATLSLALLAYALKERGRMMKSREGKKSWIGVPVKPVSKGNE